MRTRNSEQEDFLLRMLQEAARIISGLRQRLVGGVDAASTIRAEFERAAILLLGEDRLMLEQLDAESAVRLLGNTQRIERWVELLELDAEARRQTGEGEQAARLLERARALRAAMARQLP